MKFQLVINKLLNTIGPIGNIHRLWNSLAFKVKKKSIAQHHLNIAVLSIRLFSFRLIIIDFCIFGTIQSIVCLVNTDCNDESMQTWIHIYFEHIEIHMLALPRDIRSALILLQTCIELIVLIPMWMWHPIRASIDKSKRDREIRGITLVWFLIVLLHISLYQYYNLWSMYTCRADIAYSHLHLSLTHLHSSIRRRLV